MSTEKTKVEQEGEERTRIGNTPPSTIETLADAGADTLEYFATTHGEVAEDDTGNKSDIDAQNIADLLADLAHYCDREGLHLASIWESAAMHYNEETDNQGTQFETDDEDADQEPADDDTTGLCECGRALKDCATIDGESQHRDRR